LKKQTPAYIYRCRKKWKWRVCIKRSSNV
jgi:hypothetical protein